MTRAFAADIANLPALERLIEDVSDLQGKLILLVGSSGKTRLLRALARRLNTASLNIGVELGRRLTATPDSDRGFSLNESLREVTVNARNDVPLLLDNLEVLFEPSLKINPLNVIKLLAHSRPVIAAWPGEMRDDHLIYAGIGHPEHRDYTRDGVVVFETAQSHQGAGRPKV
ncbi:BREX-3 system P-loop-containing protein BrxF [Zavarzinia aquatilis]|uniref:BREX-3 system P-loop-containing protein BrxF n=1 Tax=Zavarzinia aquatilis TaxID=2211142 RepID=A0A317DTD4_9PROT|nr:BREX-3 system P-loop-containing protein BrxF [Zavarzinia aquatilis]PWR17931.1 BREX-3 system P-loop-containing protein BrxF [Zavarzinia aquatilis]